MSLSAHAAAGAVATPAAVSAEAAEFDAAAATRPVVAGPASLEASGAVTRAQLDVAAPGGPIAAGAEVSSAPVQASSARLIGRLYRSAPRRTRVELVRSLIRPLSPLALVAVADGAFAFALMRDPAQAGGQAASLAAAQVAELADFALQVEPAVLAQVVELLGQPAALPGLAAAAMALLLQRRRASGRRPG